MAGPGLWGLPRLGGRLVTASDGARWLAGAHHDPDAVWRGWDTRSVALLPAGVRWDAVALPHAHVVPLLDTPALRGVPVLLDVPCDRAYVLTIPGATWDALPETTRLGSGYWLVMSQPDGPRQANTGRWLVPPRGMVPRLADPAALRAALLTFRTAP